jgi:hypothetical protein
MFHLVFGARNATYVCVLFVILLVVLPVYVKMAYLVFSCCESSVFVMFGMSRV